MWINGDCEQARNLWIDWLMGEFKKFCTEESLKVVCTKGLCIFIL